MTNDEILQAAKEVGAVSDVLMLGRHDNIVFTTGELEAFYHAAITKATKQMEEEVERLCKSGYVWRMEMTQTIEQLTTRVRELEEANARLRFALADTEALELGTSERLAASQLHAEQLRKALETLNKASNIGCSLVDDALALPRDTRALDSYVEQKVKEAMK